MKKAMCIFLITCIIICSSQIMGYDQQAATVYVDDDRPPSWYDANHVATVQEGIANVSANGLVYIYNGSYTFDDGGNNLEIHKQLSIRGQHRDGVILTSVPLYETAFESYNGWINISHLTVHGAREGFISEAGAGSLNHINISHCKFINCSWASFLTKVHNFTAYNNSIINSTQTAIFVQISNDVKICNNIIINASEQGFIFGWHGTTVNRVYVFNNYIEKTEYQGMFVRTTSNANFLNNTFVDCGNGDYPGTPSLRYSQCSLHFHNSNNINVENTYINMSNHSGIYVNESNNITIYNNIIKDNNHSGVHVNNSEYITIAYCDIRNNSYNGILVNESTNNIFAYNEVYDNNYGVYIE